MSQVAETQSVYADLQVHCKHFLTRRTRTVEYTVKFRSVDQLLELEADEEPFSDLIDLLDELVEVRESRVWQAYSPIRRVSEVVSVLPADVRVDLDLTRYNTDFDFDASQFYTPSSEEPSSFGSLSPITQLRTGEVSSESQSQSQSQSQSPSEWETTSEPSQFSALRLESSPSSSSAPPSL